MSLHVTACKKPQRAIVPIRNAEVAAGVLKVRVRMRMPLFLRPVGSLDY